MMIDGWLRGDMLPNTMGFVIIRFRHGSDVDGYFCVAFGHAWILKP